MKKLLEYGMGAFVFLLPWQTVWIIQEATIGPQGAMGVWQYGTLKIYAIEFLIAVLFSLALFRTITRVNKKSLCIDQWHALSLLEISMLAFALVGGISILWSDNRLVALFAFVRLLEGVFLFFLFRAITLRWSWFLGAWIAAAVIQSVLGIWQFVSQEVIANTYLGIAAHDPVALGTSVVEGGDRRWLRAYGGFPHPNIFGAYLAVSLVWCGVVLSRAREKWQWILVILSSQTILIALLLSFSRSAWLALFISVFVWLICARHRTVNLLTTPINPSAVLVLASIVTIGIFSLYFTEELKGRIGIVESRLESQSITERVSSLARALPLMQEVWYRGTGIGNFTNTLFHLEQERGIALSWYTYQPLHNVPFMIVAELGIFGLLLFCIIFILIFRSFPPTLYPLPSTLLILSLFDHFLWTLPLGVFLVFVSLGFLQNQSE